MDSNYWLDSNCQVAAVVPVVLVIKDQDFGYQFRNG